MEVVHHDLGLQANRVLMPLDEAPHVRQGLASLNTELGMRRRVALARAFFNEPGLLLLDEPFLSLDAPVANHLRRVLLELCGRRSATVLFVTHDLREALYLADRVLFMSGGPGSMVLDLPVELPLPREPESEAVERLRMSLLKEHPRLLAGLVEEKGQ